MFDAKRAREICENATKGTWEWVPEFNSVVSVIGSNISDTMYSQLCTPEDCEDKENDMVFITQARTLLPEAILEIEGLRTMLEQFEWSERDFDDEGKAYRTCPYCLNAKEDGHYPECRMGKALGRECL